VKIVLIDFIGEQGLTVAGRAAWISNGAAAYGDFINGKQF
jgi:hypothetical protein